MILFPNAKINIGLFVTNKRSDGFHDIESIFYPVALCDVLEVIISSEPQTTIATTGGNELIVQEENIVWRAYKLLCENFELPNFKIHLHKVIPTGAGLGGGSSDAAFTLQAINSLCNLNLSNPQLAAYASRLGSDCGFFIENTPQFVRGRGEILNPTELKLKGKFIVIVNPGIHIGTLEAYQKVKVDSALFDLRNIATLPAKNWKNNVVNSFEIPATESHPVIGSIKTLLYESGAFFASMTGSGSSVYGLFESEPNLSHLFNGKFYWQGRL